MKKLLFTSMLFSLVIPFFGNGVQAQTDPAITDPEMNSEFNDPAIDGSSDFIWEDDQMGAQRMEENDEAQVIDYNDRTRTDRERKALNTGSSASDDK